MPGPGRHPLAWFPIIAPAVLLVSAPAAALASKATDGGSRAAVPFDTAHFLAAVRDASVPEASEIDDHLFALSAETHGSPGAAVPTAGKSLSPR